MTYKTDASDRLTVGLFLAGPGGRFLGPALLARSSAAILTARAARDVLTTGLEGLNRQYWIVAGPADASPEVLFGAPATELRIAEEPDPDAVHHVAIALDLAAWSDDTGSPPRAAAFTGFPCTKAQAAEVGKLVSAAPDPDADWLAAAASAVPDLVRLYETPALRRTLPAWLPPDTPEPYTIWPFSHGNWPAVPERDVSRPVTTGG